MDKIPYYNRPNGQIPYYKWPKGLMEKIPNGTKDNSIEQSNKRQKQ